MHIVIVGGGFGGTKTALELANKPGISVTLINPTTNFEYHGALYRTATGRSPLEVAIPYREIFENAKNVEFILDRVTSIEPHKRRIIGEHGNIYPYDAAVLALGNVVNYFGIKGMEDHSFSLDTVSNTIALRHELAKVVQSAKHEIRIAVVGAGPSGVELAAELPSFLKMLARKKAKTHKKIEVVLVEGSPRVLPTMSEQVSRKVSKRLGKLGINVRLNTKVNSCEPGKVCLDGHDLHADIIVWTAGSKPVDFFERHPNYFELERGKVKVDEYLQAEELANVYVVGDNAATPYSGMAQTALHDAKFVANNFLRMHKGAEPTKYRKLHPVYVIPVGPKWAVLQTGKKVVSGYRGWAFRRKGDLKIFQAFEPYKKAIKTWRKGNKVAKF